MPTSESVINITAALQEAQTVGLVVVSNRRNQQTSSRYANLTDCVEALLPAMQKHGLGFLQFLGGIRLEGNLHVAGLTTRLIHKSGEWIETYGEFPLAQPPVSKSGNQILNWSQNHGLALTYAKRYALVSAFGLATGDDDDAQRLLGAGAPQQPTKELEHWSNYVNGEWEEQFAPGTKTPLKELSEDELRAVWKDHFKTFPPIVGRLADKINDQMVEHGIKWITMEKPAGTPESLFAMDTRQLVAFGAHVRLLVDAKTKGEQS